MSHDDDMSEQRDLAAGDFASWASEMSDAIQGKRASSVPCAGCTACCTSSQFIHIGPDETDTLAHIPAELLFPAPMLPRGHVLLGYDEQGRCPMLVDDRCSIYEHRPRTCRTYDCRIFPAAGLALDDDGDKVLIARQARRWQFSFPAEADRTRHDAVRAAATFLRAHAAELSAEIAPASTTRLAVLALEIHEVFLQRDGKTGHAVVVEPALDAVRAEVMRRTQALRATRERKRRGR